MQEREGIVVAPGRVNLIGEHIDCHGLPVLPMALQRSIRVEYRRRTDRTIRACSTGFGERVFEWTSDLQPVAAGDWENYLRAAAALVVAAPVGASERDWTPRSNPICLPPRASLLLPP